MVENFNFQHMVSMKAMLIFNFENISQKIMKPWIECALIQDCIEPIGAQSTGCRFVKLKVDFRLKYKHK